MAMKTLAFRGRLSALHALCACSATKLKPPSFTMRTIPLEVRFNPTTQAAAIVYSGLLQHINLICLNLAIGRGGALERHRASDRRNRSQT